MPFFPHAFLGLDIIPQCVLFVLLVPIWVLPIVLAVFRGHPHAPMIGAIVLFTGHTFVGWGVCLVWSLLPAFWRTDDDDALSANA